MRVETGTSSMQVKVSMAKWKGVDMLEEYIEDQYGESTLGKEYGTARGGCEMGGWVGGL